MKFFAPSSLLLILLVRSSAVSAAHLKQATRQEVIARQNLGPVALAARASPSPRPNNTAGGSNAQHGNPHGNQNSHHNSNNNGHH